MSESYNKIPMHRWLIFALFGNPANIKQASTWEIILFLKFRKKNLKKSIYIHYGII